MQTGVLSLKGFDPFLLMCILLIFGNTVDAQTPSSVCVLEGLCEGVTSQSSLFRQH